MSPEPSKTITRRATLALGAAAALLCSTTASFAQDKVIKVLRSPVGSFQGLFIAEEQGYFAEAGLKVEVAIGGAPAQNIAAMQSGRANIIITGSFDLITAAAQGLPVKGVLNTNDQGPIATTGVMVPPGSAVATLADLKDKSIGVPGVQSVQGLMLFRGLETAGLTPNDVKLVNLPVETMVESSKNGNVDAIVPMGFFYSLAEFADFQPFPDAQKTIQGLPAAVYASTDSWIGENEEALKAFVGAMEKAYAYGNANQEAVRAVDAAQTQMPPDYIATRPIVPFQAAFNVPLWEDSVKDMLRFGFLTKEIKADDFVWSGAPRQ